MATFPLILRLAGDLENISPFYEEPSVFDFVQWPRRPQQQLIRRCRSMQPWSGDVTPHVGKDGFQVSMDVAQFKPSELSVKVVENSIVVEGKHEEREDDHGFISRHFVRRYALPKDYDSEKVASTLSSDGVLTVSIPKPQIEDKSKERHIQIQQTGPAHLNVKVNSVEAENEAKKEEASKK